MDAISAKGKFIIALSQRPMSVASRIATIWQAYIRSRPSFGEICVSTACITGSPIHPQTRLQPMSIFNVGNQARSSHLHRVFLDPLSRHPRCRLTLPRVYRQVLVPRSRAGLAQQLLVVPVTIKDTTGIVVFGGCFASVFVPAEPKHGCHSSSSLCTNGGLRGRKHYSSISRCRVANRNFLQR